MHGCLVLQQTSCVPPLPPLPTGMAWLPESPRWLLLSGAGPDAAAAALWRAKGRVASSAAVQVRGGPGLIFTSGWKHCWVCHELGPCGMGNVCAAHAIMAWRHACHAMLRCRHAMPLEALALPCHAARIMPRRATQAEL